MEVDDLIINIPVSPALVLALAAWLLVIVIKWLVQTIKP